VDWLIAQIFAKGVSLTSRRADTSPAIHGVTSDGKTRDSTIKPIDHLTI
jgi:hypothetical protein